MSYFTRLIGKLGFGKSADDSIETPPPVETAAPTVAPDPDQESHTPVVTVETPATIAGD